MTRIKSCIFIVGEWLLLRIGLHLTGSEKLSLQVTLTLMQQICNYRCVRLFNAIAIKRYRETICIFNVLKHKSISAFHPLCLMCNKNTKTGNFEFRVRPSCRSHFSWKIFFSCSAKKPDSSGGKQDRDQHLIWKISSKKYWVQNGFQANMPQGLILKKRWRKPTWKMSLRTIFNSDLGPT